MTRTSTITTIVAERRQDKAHGFHGSAHPFNTAAPERRQPSRRPARRPIRIHTEETHDPLRGNRPNRPRRRAAPRRAHPRTFRTPHQRLLGKLLPLPGLPQPLRPPHFLQPRSDVPPGLRSPGGPV